MKAVIFAGGVGTRLWPLSRKKSPKQFEKIIGDKSTLQLATERLLPEFAAEDIYISTGKPYVHLVEEQLPFIPKENIISEPAKRDVGPAVGLIMGHLAQKFPNEPVVILWSDHLVNKTELFKKIIFESGEQIKKQNDQVIFIGQKPRFASENLGWIHIGKKAFSSEGIGFNEFDGFKYRPDAETSKTYFDSKQYCWNLGYFVTSPAFMYSLFKMYAPQVYEVTERIVTSANPADFARQMDAYYPEMPEISFDNAVLEHMDKAQATVVVEDIGWSDIGAWEALKEALEEHRHDNITKGQVMLEDSADCLVYNYEDKKIIVGVDLDDLLVVNTNDALLVAKKSSVTKIKNIVNNFQGTENEHLT
ncbi:MAG: sugar phosphate nucleotidyltransferase [bacterium]|nr:sugar phosphate nucleotidyltransferase [bacterium]